MTVKMDMFCCQLEMMNALHVKSENLIVLKSTHTMVQVFQRQT